MRISDWSSDVCSSDLREDPGKEKESDCSAGARLSNGGLLAVSSVRSRHRSVSLGALGRTAPVHRPVGSVGIGPEQVGADRLREDGIVYRPRGVVAGIFADTLHAGADRSEERRVGTGCASTRRSRWYQQPHTTTTNIIHQ